MYEETLVVLKPDALERKLIGSIIKRYEESGVYVLDIRYVRNVSKDMIKRHYPDSMAYNLGVKAQKAMKDIEDPESHGEVVLERLRQYFTRGPVIAIKLGGENAIQTTREVTGYTDPATAKKGTIRGDYGIDAIAKSTEEDRACENLVHASGNLEEAKREITLWFPKNRS